MTKQEELFKLLSEGQILPAEQLSLVEKEYKTTSKKIEDILIDRKMMDPEKLTKLRAQIYNLPYASLIESDIEGKVLNIFPARWLTIIK